MATNNYTDVEITRKGKTRITKARVEKMEMADGSVKYHVRTKGGLTVGGFFTSEVEARAKLLGLIGEKTPSVNDKVYNAIVRHQVQLERYKAGVFKAVKPVLTKTISDIVRKIDSLPENTTRARYERVLAEIQVMNIEASNKLAAKLKDELKQLADQEREFVHSAITESIPTAVAVKIGLPSLNELRKLINVEPFHGLVLEEWTKKIGQAATLRARQQLYIGLAEGESIPKIVKRMQFIGDQSTRDLEMVVRTSINHVTNQVKSSVYGENSDVLSGVMWRSTLDGRTSEICQARDGEIYPLDEHPVPPAHPNCRSVLVPIIKSYKQLGYDAEELPEGTRASMNGQVPASETYDSWLRKQPKEFVVDVLGEGKAKLFLNDGLTLDKFVDTSGRTLTIEELKKKR